MSTAKHLVLAAAVAVIAGGSAVAETVVDDFEAGFAPVAGVGDVASGWSVWDWGPKAQYSFLNYSLFDPSIDDEIAGDTLSTGPNGICEVLEQGDDIQVIALGQGEPDIVCINPGPDTVLDSSPVGDDQTVGDTIVTGADGVCDTTASGDDEQVIPVGQGNPNSTGIGPGDNGELDTDNTPDIWAGQVTGFGWVGSAQEMVTRRGTRGIAKGFPVTPGQHYLLSAKMKVEALGNRRNNRGIVGMGYDQTGQTTDPTPKGAYGDTPVEQGGTVRWRDIWNSEGWVCGEMEYVVEEGWHNQYLTFEASGTEVSVWFKIDDQDRQIGDGYRLTVDDVSLTPFTPDPSNKVYNGYLEERSSARTEAPAGFMPFEARFDPPEESYVLREEYSPADVGRQCFSGQGAAAGGRESDALGGGTTGLYFIAEELADNATYLFQIQVYEESINREGNVGIYGGLRCWYNTTGEFDYWHNTQLESPGRSQGDSDNPAYLAEWSYPHQGRGWWTYDLLIQTDDFQVGTDDERLIMRIDYLTDKCEPRVYFDDVSLVEQAPSKASPFIEITNVSYPHLVPGSGEVTITWDTDVASTSEVEYGTWESLGNTSGLDPTLLSSHSVTLTGLQPQDDLYFRVVSTAANHLDATSVQHRILSPHVGLVNGGFEGGFWSRVGTPEITTGANGICNTTADAADVQVIPVSQGLPGQLCVTAGPDEVLDTPAGGDDVVLLNIITTGPDGVCNSAVQGDDVQVIAVGRGLANQVCVSCGGDSVLTSVRAGDDRSTEDMRPVGWEFYGYSHGLYEGFQGAQYTFGQDANGALYGFDATEAAGAKGAGDVYTGLHAMGFDTCVTMNGENGGMCQKVATDPGEDYVLTVQMRGYDDYITREIAGRNNVGARLGVDPAGGSDPTAATVVWSPYYFFGAPDDVQEIPFGQGKPDALNIEPGVLWSDYTLDSTPAGDDATLDVLFWGADQVLDSTPGGDDYVSSQDWWPSTDVIHPGPNGVIDSTPVNDDVVVTVITAGADGISDTPADANDLPMIFDVGWGTPDVVCVTAGADGILSSGPGEDPVPSGDDMIVGETLTVGTDGVCGSYARVAEGPDHFYNYEWYERSLEFAAGSEAATVFLNMHAVYAPVSDKHDHVVWFDDAEFELSIESMTWDSAQAGWNLMSLPIDPADPDPAVVFADLATCGNVIGTNLYRYSKLSGYELYPSAQFTAMETGRAYWLRLTSVCDNTVSGTLLSAPQSIALDDGWNMFGMPLSTPVLWSGCQITDGVDTKSIADAGTAGWIQTLIYYYTPTGYKTVKPDGTGDDDSLRPWVGYWFLTYQAGLSLIVQ